MKPLELTGQRFGRLIVLGREQNKPGQCSRWSCVCDCGNKLVVASSSLKRGFTRSCGCFRRIAKRASSLLNGRSQTAEYRSWCSAKSRCIDENFHAYHRYGGRGIRMCDRWVTGEDGKHPFECFLEDMGPKPKGYQLDRIDNDGGYCPDNCVWSSRSKNCGNRCTSRVIRFNGKSQCISDWAKEYGIHKTTLKYRLDKGWPMEEATIPTMRDAL